MATEIEKVRPGDVITSELMNVIITKLNDLDEKVSSLPSGGGGTPGGPPNIPLTFLPTATVGQAVGAEVTVTGQFDFPPGLNTVTLDGQPITNFRDGSNLTTLKFLIPETINVTTPRSTTFRVVNSKGIGEGSYLLKPKEQSSEPTPEITSVINHASPAFGTLLQTGVTARITGTNFATTPANNAITMNVVNPSTNANINVTVPTSNIVSVSPDRTELVFTVPDIPQMGVVGTQSNGTLELKVTGNNVGDSEGITVIRMQPQG